MDMRSQFVVSVADVVAGSTKEVELSVPAPADCGVGLIGVPEGSQIQAAVSLQALSEGIFVQGEVSATAEGECSRCATPIVRPLDEQVAELVFWPERRDALVSEGDDEVEDLPVVEDMHIDLEPILRDALVLSLPFTPVCSPDCEGLCSECGEPWKDLPDDHQHEFLNPAFSALDSLVAELKEDK